jgi:hypothetical protein
MLLALGLVVGPRVPAKAVELTTPAEGVNLPGRVVDLETGKPIKDALIVVERLMPGLPTTIVPTWVGESRLTTAGDGRFVLIFPAQQVAERRLSISLRVAHPDYISRKTATGLPLVAILRGRDGGDRPFFETIKLAKGVEYSGQIVTPEGGPAAGETLNLTSWDGQGNPSQYFFDDTERKTDGEGRFRLRAPKAHHLVIYVTPAQHAPFQRY